MTAASTTGASSSARRVGTGSTRRRAVRRRRRSSGRILLSALTVAAVALSGCSLFAAPRAPAGGPSLAPPGLIGYAVCPGAVTPVELATGTAEPDIRLPVVGSPALGDYAIATSPDGHWAYVVTTEGSSASPTATSSGPVTSVAPGAPTTVVPPGQNVVIPVDLVTQRAGRPVDIPGSGATRAIVVLPDGRTVIAASGSSLVPIDVADDRAGTPIELGPTHPIFGMALNPAGTTLYVLVPGGVFPVDTARGTVGAAIPTGLSVSSEYSPHGIVVTANGATVYVVGQGGSDYGGRVVPIDTATGQVQPAASFDRFGIAAPAALAVAPDGASLLAVDAANNWVNPVRKASFTVPDPPVRLPDPTGAAAGSGTQHPSDIVLTPDGTTAYIVDGFAAVIPYVVATQTFGHAIPVCTGASSMTVASAP